MRTEKGKQLQTLRKHEVGLFALLLLLLLLPPSAPENSLIYLIGNDRLRAEAAGGALFLGCRGWGLFLDICGDVK